jgi:hypothetical protein
MKEKAASIPQSLVDFRNPLWSNRVESIIYSTYYLTLLPDYLRPAISSLVGSPEVQLTPSKCSCSLRKKMQFSKNCRDVFEESEACMNTYH